MSSPPAIKPRVKVTPWRTIVLSADPEFSMEDNNTEEYRFSNGRVFRGNYKNRGPYEP